MRFQGESTFEAADEPERWLPIEGWPGYEVSDLGRVQSYWGSGGKTQGQRGIGLTPKIIGGYVQAKGHKQVLLYRNGSMEKRRASVHVLVLEVFVGPRPPGMFACHNDGDPGNNRLDNLRWDSPRSNSQDALRHGTSNLAVLAEGDIPKIWERILAGDSDAAIGRDRGVSGTAIGAIRSGQAWNHVARYLPGWPIRTEAQKAMGNPVFVPDDLAKASEELWRPLPDWPAYRVSNRGRIQSCLERAKGVGVGRGAMILSENWKDRALVADKDGYRIFWARRNGEKPTMLKAHACVLLAFAGPAPIGFVACHNDGNRSNNHADNLRWDTLKANAVDRGRHNGRRKRAI